MAIDTETPVVALATDKKLERVLRRTLPLLPADVAEQLKALVSPTSLGLMAGTLGVWAASHFFGVGEIADIVLLLVGWVALGGAALEAAGHLAQFIQRTVGATREADLDDAAQHLARAITLIGVQTVLILLLRRKPENTFKNSWGDPLPPYAQAFPKPLPRSEGWFYKPKVRFTNELLIGEGGTNAMGDIRIGRFGSGERAMEGIRHTLYHEQVHQFLTPKLQIFREIQVYMRRSAYHRSYILRYLEEALAETVAMLRTQGLGRESLVQGIRFPIKKQYNISWALIGTEARGILFGPVTVEGLVYNVYFDFDDESGSDR